MARINQRQFGYTCLLVSALVWCTVSCTRTKQPGTPAASSRSATQAAQASSAPAKLSKEAIIESWRRAAALHKLTQEAQDRVSLLVADALSDVQASPLESDILKLDESLDAYLRQQSMLFSHRKSSRGIEYWTAYCIAKAFDSSRPALPRQQVVAGYNAVLEEVVQRVEKGVYANLPADQHAAMKPLIEEGLGHLRRECQARISLYVDDILCPAFKVPLSLEKKAKVRARYEDPSKLPKFEEPVTMMVTKAEAFRKKYKDYIENQVGLLLFDMFILSTDRLNVTDIWGYMDYKARSADVLSDPTAWPAEITFTPNQAYNKGKGWVRPARKETK